MAPSSYDEVPYPSLPIRRNHPSNLAAIARLFGVTPPPPNGSRVLELGCASADNLLPLAADFPDSHYVGIDLSSRQIETGRNSISQLGLKNIELHDLDLNELDSDFGTFDYIICHGVFSWVPRAIQNRILEIGRNHLSSNGVFCVSYNAYPGWHMRGVVRDMMAFHVRDLTDPAMKVSQARALLDFLTKSASPTNDTYMRLLLDEAAILKTRQDGYLYHEHLEDVNDPLYFYQFVERAVESDLQYLGDADLPGMLPSEMSADVKSLLEDASLLQQEQYLDFLRNRTFRTSLLCHRELALQRQLDSRRLTACDVGLEESLSLPVEFQSTGAPLSCETVAGRIKVERTLSQAALYVLNDAWPSCLTFSDLLKKSMELVPAAEREVDEERQAHLLARDILTLYLQRLVIVWDQAPRCAARPSDLPQTTDLVRWQASRGVLVTNRRHETLQVSDFDCYLLGKLDGSRSQAELADSIANDIRSGQLSIAADGPSQTLPADEVSSELVKRTLDSLAKRALLVEA